jgi:hypothetical protein
VTSRRTVISWWIAGVLGPAACVSAQVSPDTSLTRPDLATVGSLPSSVEMVVAARGLADVRARPSGKALEAFLRDVGDWRRSAAAWDELGHALGMSQDKTVNALIGSGVVLVGTGMDPQHEGPGQFAVLSTVDARTESLLRAKLRPAPKGSAGSLPILSVEDGAYQLAISTPAGQKDGETTSRLLVAPEGSRALFDALVPVLKGKQAESPLSATKAWGRVRDLGPGDLLVLLSPGSQGTVPQEHRADDLFALMASATEDGWIARFSGTDTSLPGGDPSAAADWPTAAVDALEEGSVLMVAGSPRSSSTRPMLLADQNLLVKMLDIMGLPEEFKATFDGNAIVAVHAEGSAGGSDQALSVLAVLPVPDIGPFAGKAEKWAMSMGAEGADWQDAPVTLKQGVRSVPIPSRAPALIPEDLRSKGVMAWCYAHHKMEGDEERPRGWWVVSLRFGAGDAGAARVVARRVASLLEGEEGKDTSTMFRLVVRPRELMELMRPPASRESAPVPKARTKDPLLAMRWLEQVDSRVSRSAPGMIEGSVSLKFNLRLLQEPAAK